VAGSLQVVGFVLPMPGHSGGVFRVIRHNLTVRAVLAAMGLFVFVALIWGAVGYVYADHDKAAAGAKVGLGILAVGWLAVWSAAAVKFVRLRARRRKSDEQPGRRAAGGRVDRRSRIRQYHQLPGCAGHSDVHVHRALDPGAEPRRIHQYHQIELEALRQFRGQ